MAEIFVTEEEFREGIIVIDMESGVSTPPSPRERKSSRSRYSYPARAEQAAKGKLTNPKSKIIERVLERNLMQPSTLTFFDDQEAAFFIVEPHIREADLKEFAELP